MSCASKACTSIEISHSVETAGQRWSLLRLWRAIEPAIHKARVAQIRRELEKARQRGLLRHLEDWQLRDIGLTRDQADREARKPFWK